MRVLPKANKLTQFFYLLQRVINDLIHRKITAIFTLLAIALSVSLPTTGYLVWKNVQVMATNFSPTSEITVFLKQDVTDNKGKILASEIKKIEGVDKVNYLSSAQTLNEFKAWEDKNNSTLLNDHFLPAVITVTPIKSFQTTEKLDFIASKLKKIKGIEEVQFEKVFLQKITILSSLIIKIVFFLAILMFVAVLLVMTNSIRAEVFSSKNKIEVMRLLGATNSFILRPFLYRSMIYCILSAIFALLISQWFLFYFYPIVANVSSIFDINFQLMGFNFMESSCFILGCILFGYFSTYIATSYHLTQVEKKQR